jgi:dTDP-4-dehydrorhamnose reductase
MTMTDQHGRPRLVVLGANGQVGWELARALAPLGDVVAHDRASVDLADEQALRMAASRAGDAPMVIVNAAAYTAVDRAEAEPARADAINGDAPSILAQAAADEGALLVHYSTDYVFNGEATRPYTELDPPDPRTAYGRSKWRGDEAVLASDAYAYVFRVGWVYGLRGRNFLGTMRRLAAERDEVRVVRDQHGAPTWSRAIAEATAQSVGQWLAARREARTAPPRGLYHLAPPDRTTWHGFAEAIVASMSFPAGRPAPTVRAITTEEYPTPAARPRWSVLDGGRARDAFGLVLPPWRVQLAQCLADAPSVLSTTY